jgi:hypothetical protein
LAGLGAALQALPLGFAKVNTVRVFQGDFVLTVSEGRFAGKACAYSDLFRVAAGKIAVEERERQVLNAVAACSRLIQNTAPAVKPRSPPGPASPVLEDKESR